ncbi:MAG: glycoside hydrolase family protein [Sphingomicrobium sp.]
MNLVLLEAELRRDEGVRYTRYLDSRGIPTTGVGHNLLAAPLPAAWTYPLTDAQVDQLLAQDLTATFAGLDAQLPWWRALDDVRQRVVANMAFNLGVDKLLGFKNTLAAMQRGSYAVAAAGMKASAWYSQVGARAQRLCQAMETGVMPEPAVIA